MPKPKSIVHALVLWGRTAEDKKNRDKRRLCDVLELSSIPRKFRKEGATPMLKWMDKETKKASMNKATIIKISDDVEKLQQLSVGMTGNVPDSTAKLFGSDVLHKRKELQQAKRRAKSLRNKGGNDSELPSSSPMQTDEEDNDESAEDTETKVQRFMNAMKELASQVTEENIRFLESVLDVMKASKLANGRPETKEKVPFKIPAYYTTPGRGKVPIWEGMDFYLYEGVKKNIETKSYVLDKTTGEQIRHWPLLVRLALVEIYGKRLADHSAKGSKSGSRPAIDHRLFRAIHYWASDWVGNEVDVDAYVDHINKTCYNKRKGTPDIKKREKKVAATNTTTLSNEAGATSTSAIEFVDVGQPSTLPESEENQAASNNLVICPPKLVYGEISFGVTVLDVEEFERGWQHGSCGAQICPINYREECEEIREPLAGETFRRKNCASHLPGSFSYADGLAVCHSDTHSSATRREKVRVAFLGPTPSPATPGVLLLEPLLPTSGHLIDGMSASPAELLTTHTEHTSPAYHAQISTDSGWDNPFRPDGDLSREADEIVELIKGGKPITPTPGQNAPPLPGCEATGKPIEGDLLDSSTSPLLNASSNSTGGRPGEAPRGLSQGNGNAHGTPGKPGNANSATKQQPVNEKVGQATTATVEVGRVTAQGPGDASQVEHVTLKKKPKCKCCVLQ